MNKGNKRIKKKKAKKGDEDKRNKGKIKWIIKEEANKKVKEIMAF